MTSHSSRLLKLALLLVVVLLLLHARAAHGCSLAGDEVQIFTVVPLT